MNNIDSPAARYSAVRHQSQRESCDVGSPTDCAIRSNERRTKSMTSYCRRTDMVKVCEAHSNKNGANGLLVARASTLEEPIDCNQDCVQTVLAEQYDMGESQRAGGDGYAETDGARTPVGWQPCTLSEGSRIKLAYPLRGR